MLIRIMYRNRSQDMVKPRLLNQLIAADQVRKFKRANGWVDVRCDPIRGAGERAYAGPERRHPE